MKTEILAVLTGKARAFRGDEPSAIGKLPIADAVVSTRAGLALSVRVADCVPVLLVDLDAGG